jgi:hypothetical protein
MSDNIVEMNNSGRKQHTDEEAINAHFSQYKGWLQANGIPTPTKAEFRMMLYSSLYVEFQKQVKNFQDSMLENLREQLPQVQQAMKEYKEKYFPETPEEVK